MTAEELAKLTPEQKRVKIAEACGWTFVASTPDEGGSFAGWWQSPHGMGCGYTDSVLPNYLSSLDAMHEAEKTLDDMQYGKFCKALQRITGCGMHSITWRNERAVISATASQRADAFLLTI